MITTTTVQIASVPERVDSLKLTVESVINQVDLVFVALNSYTEVPSFLCRNPKISYIILDNSLTDGAKCFDVGSRKGYVFLLDDDIQVPSNYCDFMRKATDKYKCIVSLHGKYYNPLKFRDFYAIERNYRCLGTVLQDAVVNVVGSGVMCYNTQDFKLSYADIKSPNMCDIWISKAAKEQGVKIIVLAHKAGFIKHINFTDNLFVRENRKKFIKQTEILKTFLQ